MSLDVGDKAPSFSLQTDGGGDISLKDLKGQTVVLEWWNPECPFVGKHYGSGSMQRLQKEWTGKGVAWLTVDSSAPGQQGFVDGARATALMSERHGASTANS